MRIGNNVHIQSVSSRSLAAFIKGRVFTAEIALLHICKQTLGLRGNIDTNLQQQKRQGIPKQSFHRPHNAKAKMNLTALPPELLTIIPSISPGYFRCSLS